MQLNKNSCINSCVGKIISVGVIRTVAGGIGAELGGGKFVNGAATAAFAYLFNDVRETFPSPQPGRASISQSLEKTIDEARQDGEFWSENGCRDTHCTVTDVSLELIVDGARASSRDSELYDWGVDIGATILSGNPIPLSKKDVALDVLDRLTGYIEKGVKFGLGDKAPGLMANDLKMNHTARGSNGHGTVFTYTQIIRQDFQNPGQYYRFRY